MKWKDVGEAIAKYAPMLGKAVGNFVPGAGAIGAGISLLCSAFGIEEDEDPARVLAKIQMDPEWQVKLARIEKENRIELQKLMLTYEVHMAAIEAKKEIKTIEAVNRTMGTEASQGHPWSGAWRPFWGFASAISFGLCVLGLIFLAGYSIYKGKSDLLATIPTMAMSVTALFGVPGAILGVASWHRGKMQRLAAGDQPGAGLISQISGMVLAGKGPQKQAN